jgi:hypothetical protein
VSMTSLRLAEAFIRTAAPEGHEPLRDLAELRAHMDNVHQLGVAGMLPLHVLMHMHEKDHGDHEQEWRGSPDASRSPRFTAVRNVDDPRDVFSDGGDWDRMKDSLAEHGFPDSQMRLDTGHKMWLYHVGPRGREENEGLFGADPRPGFHVQVWHPGGDQGHVVEAHLGEVPEHAGPLLHRMFRRPDVLGHMRGQMDRAQGHGPDQTGNRLLLDMTRGR